METYPAPERARRHPENPISIISVIGCTTSKLDQISLTAADNCEPHAALPIFPLGVKLI
jgi:hypothetical protein